MIRNYYNNFENKRNLKVGIFVRTHIIFIKVLNTCKKYETYFNYLINITI